MASAAKKDGVSYWIRVAIWIALSFMGWFLPAIDPITSFGMKVLFVHYIDCNC